MSAIRPLATIAILAALGVFLAMKINQEPLAPTASVGGDWGDAPAFGDPGGEAPAFGEAPTFGGEPAGEAPAFGAPAPTAPPTMVPSAAPSTAPTIPDLPPLPPLTTPDPAVDPSVATTPAPAASASTTPPTGPAAVDPAQLALPDLPLPENIPQANYAATTPTGPSAGPGLAPNAKPAISGRVPTLGTATPDLPAFPPTAPAPPAMTTPEPAATTSSPPASPYATGGLSLGAGTPPAQAESGYATARPAIQAALDRDELSRAHLLLTQWYGDPNLSADDRREVNRLLSQLAGSVVYSTEHRLEPPHQVQAGETLETIAKQYGTPWQLLAKINGVAKSDAVQPGQILKVVRGPFKAVVDVSESELYLTVGGRYAGRFPAQLEGAATGEATWKVASKAAKYEPASPAADASGYAKSITLSDGSPYGGKTIELGAMGAPATAPGKVSVAAADLNDLFDILSEGSEVTVRK